MSGLTWFYIILAYLAVAVFIGGFLARIWKYATTPAPLRIAQTPAPTGSGGVVNRMVQEVVLFKSLFKSNRIIWVGGYIFHIILLVVLVMHFRFFFASVPEVLRLLITFEMFAGFLLLGALGYLFMLRLVIDRHRYISVFTDYGILLLLMGITITGISMKYASKVDIENIKAFTMGLVTFSPQNMPAQPNFIIHFTLVLLLIAYFPFSKLMHSGGLFFSPTRNQKDNPRKVRHVNPWAGGGKTAAGGGSVEAMEKTPEPTG